MQEHKVQVASTAKLYEGVRLGRNVVIEDFCVIGRPPSGAADGEHSTEIGDDSVIRSHTVIYAGTKTGARFQTGHAACIREFNRIGSDVSVGTHSVIEHRVLIEDRVRIHSQAFVPEFCHLKAGSWLGPKTTLTNARYPQSPRAKEELKGVVVGERAKVGAGVTVLPGVSIGTEAVVGAGSVVVKDVGERQVVAGNPARVINNVGELPY